MFLVRGLIDFEAGVKRHQAGRDHSLRNEIVCSSHLSLSSLGPTPRSGIARRRLVTSSAILRILLSDIGWLPVAGLLKPIVLIDLFMPQRTQENQPIDLAVRNNTTYHTADGIKISNIFG